MKSLSFSKSRKFWFIFAAIIVFAVAICFISVGIAQAQNGGSKSKPEKVANEAIVCVKSGATNTGDNNSQNNIQNSQQTLGEGDQISGATISKKLTSAPLGINVETDIAEGGNNIINSVEKDNAQSSINSTQQNQINSTNSQNVQTAETCEIYLVNCNNVDSYCSNATNDENVIWAQPNYYYYLPEDNSEKAIDADGETSTSSDGESSSANDVSTADNNVTINQSNTSNAYKNDDPLFNNQWGFDGTASGNNSSIDADTAWKNSSSTNYTENVVAVIDTGVDYDHEDISTNMWNKGTSYSKLTALGGGTYGINTTSSGSSTDPGNDQVGHGTHCASAVSTVNNNATGLCGVANNHTKIMGCKVFKVSSSGGASATTEDIVEAYNYVIVAKESGVNLSACSCSFGNSDVSQKYDYALNSMIVNAGKEGVVSVYSAGNDNMDMEGYTGSIHSNPYTIEVGASNDVGERAVFSNYGQHSINVFAPGVEMLACASSDANIGSYLPWAQDASNNWYYEQFNNSSGGISFCKLNGSTMQDVTSTISDGKAKIDMSGFGTSDNNYLFAKIPKANLSSLLSAGTKPYIAFGCDFTNCGFVDEHVGLYTWNGSETSYLYDYYCNASLRTGSHASILSNQALQAVGNYVYIGFKFKLRDKSTNPTFNLDCLGFGKSASNYTYMQGTSMATPVVSGMVGYVSSLLGATSTSDDALKLVAHITGSTVDKAALNDKCVTGGVVNLNKAISGISGVSTSQSHNPVMQSATFSASGNTITATIKGYFFGSSTGTVAVDGASTQVFSWSDNQVIITFNSVEQHLGEFIMTTSDSRVGRNYLDIAVENKGYTSLSTSDVEYTDKWGHTYTSNDLNVLRTATTNNAMYALFGADEAGITVLEKYDYSTGKWSSISTSSLTNFVQLGTAGTYSLACGYSEIYLLYPSGTSDNYTMRLATYSETQQKFIYDKSLGSKATPGDMLCNVKGKLWLAGSDSDHWAWGYNKPRSSHIMVVYPDTGELGDSVGNFPQYEYISGGNMSVYGDNVVVSDASYNYYGTDLLDPYYCNINSASTWKTPTTSLYTDVTSSFAQYYTSAGVATSAGILEVGMVTNNAKANMVDHYMEGYNTLNWSAVSNVRFASYKCLAIAAVCHDNKLYVIANDGLGGGMSFKYMNLSSIGATADSVNTLAERKSGSIAIESLALNKHELNLPINQSETLGYSVLPTNADTDSLEWTSNKTSVCTVDDTGKVTGKSKGQATITLSSGSANLAAISDTCAVTVYNSKPVLDDPVVSGTNITLNWTEVLGATKYKISIRKSGTTSWDVVSDNCTQLTYTIKDLGEKTTYDCLVQAWVDSQWTSYAASDIRQATTTSTRPVPQLVDKGDGYANIKWDAIPGATKYAIAEMENGTYRNYTIEWTGTTYKCDNLANGYGHNILVQAFVNGKWTNFTKDDYLLVEIDGETVKPTTELDSTTDHSVTLKWNHVPGAKGYAAAVRDRNGQFKTVFVDPDKRSAEIDGLIDSETYEGLVQANIYGVWSSYTEEDFIEATTKGNRPAPQEVETGDGYADIEWDAIPGATAYAIATIENGTYKNYSTTCTDTSYHCDNLANGYSHYILVQAYVDGKWSPFTKDNYLLVDIQGETKKPTTTVSGTTDASVTITWNQVPGASEYAAAVRDKNGKYKSVYLSVKEGQPYPSTATIDGLNDGAEYKAIVQSKIFGEWSTFTEEEMVDATTISYRPQPTQTGIGDGYADISWPAIQGATAYAIAEIENGSYRNYTTEWTGTTYHCDNLANGYDHYILVQAFVNGKWTNFDKSNYLTVHPTGATKPTTTLGTVTENSVTLNWAKVAGATDYAAAVRDPSGRYISVYTGADVTSAAITGLKPNTTYKCIVQCKIYGAWSTFTEADMVEAKTN